jgi:hypothetical protein
MIRSVREEVINEEQFLNQRNPVQPVVGPIHDDD